MYPNPKTNAVTLVKHFKLNKNKPLLNPAKSNKETTWYIN